jgi:site-specific DNA-cytosine methylase
MAQRLKIYTCFRIADFLKDAPFTAEGKLKAVANGVPIPLGRAIARAIMEALRVRKP